MSELHNNNTATDYTEGSIFGSILKMGIPSMIGFLTNNIYNLVDTFWVSRLPSGEAGVAALTLFGVILMLLFSFNQLVGPGSVAVISRRYGEKDFPQVEKAIKETIILKLFFGSIFGVLGFIFASDLLALVGARGNTLTASVEYGRIMFISLAIPFATYSIFTALRGVANPHMAMYLMLGSNVFNMILDPLFIFGYAGFPELGIQGAAVASVISYSLTFLVGLYLLYSGKGNIKLHLSGQAPVSFAGMWKIIRIGIPAWLGSLSFSGGRLIIAPMIATFGTGVVAAYGIGNQVFGLGVMLIVGIGLGLSSLIGHNIGSGKIERARKTGNQAILLSLGIMIVMGSAVFVYAREIIEIFLHDPETVREGIAMLRILAFAFPATAVFLMVEEIHMGVGLNTPMMVVSVIHSWGLQVLPIVIITSIFNFPITAVWWIITCSITLSASGCYVYYRQGRWLRTVV